MHPGSVGSASLLIAGTAVGAGVLAIPIQTGLAGLLPAVIGIILVWLAMLCAGLILAGSLITYPLQDTDLPSLFQNELGTIGKWLSTIGYLIIFYGLMTAYLAGSMSVLSSLFSSTKAGYLLLAFFLPATALSLFGLSVVQRSNVLIMAVLALSFVFLLGMGWQTMDRTHFAYTDWSYFPAILPIITCSFGYGVIIPTICRTLQGDIRRIRKALIWGTLIPVGVSLLWIMVIIGSIPLYNGNSPDSLIRAFMHSEPATVPLARVSGTDRIIGAGLIFSLCAILTSYLAVSTSLMSFHRDLLAPVLPGGAYWIRAALVFVPPLLAVLFSSGLFLTALDIVGGLGIAMIFGLCPGLIALKKRSDGTMRWIYAGVVLIFFFGFILLLELGQELNLLQLHPAVENWKVNHP
ncbi:MAG: aromatic amino acid transport family protein [Desulfovermiculus sp.]|nr:aromatic amino acid transport family protein [Desulfovermiculus sp.]